MFGCRRNSVLALGKIQMSLDTFYLWFVQLGEVFAALLEECFHEGVESCWPECSRNVHDRSALIGCADDHEEFSEGPEREQDGSYSVAYGAGEGALGKESVEGEAKQADDISDGPKQDCVEMLPSPAGDAGGYPVFQPPPRETKQENPQWIGPGQTHNGVQDLHTVEL